MTKIPMISVVMPVYNGEKYLCEAIDSILKQTYTDFEFIILNDGSTDRTEEIILSYDDPRIVYVKNKENLQIVKTLNKGIALAKGKYIARMDADDISLPERFEKQIIYLEKNEHVDALFGFVQYMDEAGNALASEWAADRKFATKRAIEEVLPEQNVLAHPTLMAKSALLKQYRYRECAKKSEDYELWLRFAADGRTIEKLQETLLYYRIHGASITRLSSTEWDTFEKVVRAKGCFLSDRIRHFQWGSLETRTLLGIVHDTIRLLKGVSKKRLRSLMQFLGRGWGRLSIGAMQCDAEILFLFKNADMGGAERVQLQVLRSAKQWQTITMLGKKSENKHFLDAYKKESNIIDVSRLAHFLPGRWFCSGYLKECIDRSSVKVVFGSLSGMVYDIALQYKVDEKRPLFVDLFHAMDGNIEYYALDAVNALDKRIVIDPTTLKRTEELYERLNMPDELKQRLTLIQNGVKVPVNFVKEGASGRQLTCLYVGRDAPVKRVQYIRKIAKRCPDVEFVLVGVEPHSEDACNIRAVGQSMDVDSYYRSSDILLLASEREGFPMVVMEAMAYGVIPICTNVGGIPYHITDGKNGCLVKNVNSEDAIINQFVTYIERMREDVSLRKKLSEEAYAYAKKHFDIRYFEETYRKLFREWIEKNDG